MSLGAQLGEVEVEIADCTSNSLGFSSESEAQGALRSGRMHLHCRLIRVTQTLTHGWLVDRYFIYFDLNPVVSLLKRRQRLSLLGCNAIVIFAKRLKDRLQLTVDLHNSTRMIF